MKPKRIKILFVETYTHIAGGQRGLLDLVQYLDKEEFEPVVLLQGPGKLRDELDRLGVRWIQKRLEPFKNRWLPFSWMIGVIPVLRVLKKERPDVVHSNHLYAGRYAGRAARILGIPSLVTLRLVHGCEVFDRYNRWNTLKSHDRIVSNSDLGCRVHETRGELLDKLSIIQNGMDLERFRPLPGRESLKRDKGAAYGIDAGSLVITQIASMVPQKGNEDLVRAFTGLAREHADLHLFLVGGGFAGTDNSAAIRKASREAGLEHRVHLTQYVRDVVEILNLTDISVLCSREREGLPRSVIEAMACGNPIVGTDVGGMRELVRDGENGFLIPPRNPEILGEKLDALIRDPELRRAMGAKSLEAARERHDIRVMIKKYEALYRELAGVHA